MEEKCALIELKKFSDSQKNAPAIRKALLPVTT